VEPPWGKQYKKISHHQYVHIASYLKDKILPQSIASSEKLKFVSLDKSTLWSTVTNAFFKSKNTAPTQAFSPSKHFTLSTNKQFAVC